MAYLGICEWEILRSKMVLHLFGLFPVLFFSLLENSGGSVFKDCQDTLLADHDDQMYSFKATAIDPVLVQPKLFQGWCTTVKGFQRYDNVEIDFKMQVNITGIATKGYKDEWFKRYNMYYSNDGSYWFSVMVPELPFFPEMVFSKGTDRGAYVVYWLSSVLRVRYFKIELSVGAHERACLQFEILGCDGGLRNSVGLNEGRIGASTVTTVGYAEQNYWNDVSYIYKGRDRNMGWTPLQEPGEDSTSVSVFLEARHMLTGFAVLSCPDLPCVPESVKMIWVHSVGARNLPYNSQMPRNKNGGLLFWLKDLMEGDNQKSVLHMFREPVVGNTIQLFFQHDVCSSDDDYAFCIQLEVYGRCLECFLTLGVESSNLHPNGAVKDEQMTASSAAQGHPAHYGRRQHRSAWCANSNKLADPVSAKSQYLQIDFLKLKKITAISTEGQDSNSYVDNYYVYYAIDEGAFHSLRHGERNEKMLLKASVGNLQEFYHNWFDDSPFIARYVRMNPQHWGYNMCLRVEVFGCDTDDTSAVGMEHGIISNNQIEASSATVANPKNWGRLNSGGWCVSESLLSSSATGKVLYHFLQIDLLEPHLICGVATQGKQTENPNQRPEAVTSFYLKYSFKGNEWLRYHRLLVGEYLGNSVMRYWLDPSLVARFIRFNPQSSWSPMHICMRVEIYRCHIKGFSNYLPLGMESFRISDLQLSASSEADASHSALYSRLNHHIGGGAWMPAKLDHSEYLQIDLGWIMILTGIATQGHPEKSYRTLAFKIKHGISLNEAFTDYPKTAAATGLV